MVAAFAGEPRWPTPDSLLLFATFLFMAFGQAIDLLRRLAPFAAMLLVYEAFRGLVPHLNGRVNYDWMIRADRYLSGTTELPTIAMQRLFWRGSTSWYDILYFITYVSHFVLPVLLVILAWKFRPVMHSFVIRCYLVVTTAGFVTFLLFPAAPPWLASQRQLIPEVVRVSDHVYAEMGFSGTTTLWSQIAPNPVAAVPSLHAAYAVLFVLLLQRLFGARRALLALPYPLIIFTGTVYSGEHYVIDEIIGAFYGVIAFALVVNWTWIEDRVTSARSSLQHHQGDSIVTAPDGAVPDRVQAIRGAESASR